MENSQPLFDIFEFLNIEITNDLESVQKAIDALPANKIADLKKNPGFSELRTFLFAKTRTPAFLEYVENIRNKTRIEEQQSLQQRLEQERLRREREIAEQQRREQEENERRQKTQLNKSNNQQPMFGNGFPFNNGFPFGNGFPFNNGFPFGNGFPFNSGSNNIIGGGNNQIFQSGGSGYNYISNNNTITLPSNQSGQFLGSNNHIIGDNHGNILGNNNVLHGSNFGAIQGNGNVIEGNNSGQINGNNNTVNGVNTGLINGRNNTVLG